MKFKHDDYQLKDGIYSFIDENRLTGDNQKYNKLYDKIAWSYNLSQRLYFWWKYDGEWNFRRPFLNELNISDDDNVLEISTGTADNFRFLNKNANYVGLDISMGMLKQAKKHLKRWGMSSTLVHAEGENLPFDDNSFDVVFHCGGINYFNDKKRAIDEMIRVAKPGTKLLIVDETDKLVVEQYQKNMFIKNHYIDAHKALIPLELIPRNMFDVNSEIICDGLMYKITFYKPL